MADLPQPSSAPIPNTPRALAARSDGIPDATLEAVDPPRDPGRIEQELAEIQSSTYRPNLPIYSISTDQVQPWQFYGDVDVMSNHPAVFTPLNYVRAPVQQAKVKIEASSGTVKRFLYAEWEKFWNMSLSKVQDPAYRYGWMGSECVYTIESGRLVQKEFLPFEPRDCAPLRNPAGRFVGVQGRNIERQNDVKLWAATPTIPCKGFWYAHMSPRGRLHGKSQIFAAWRDWKRLAGRDGAEEMSDLALYRSAVGYIKIGYPAGDVKSKNGAPGGVNNRVDNRQVAREMGENIKAGAAISMSTSKYPSSEGGGDQWTFDVISTQANLEQIGGSCDRLRKSISFAIGVPSELFEASETGSGYSGRAIPLQGFLTSQQDPANAIFQAWLLQIGLPLARWNYGTNVWARGRVLPLVDTLLKGQQGVMQPGQQQQPQPSKNPMDAIFGDIPDGGQNGQPQNGQQNGRIPYTGPRGGHGYRSANGKIHYGMSTSAGSVATLAIENGTAANGSSPLGQLQKLAGSLPQMSFAELTTLRDRLTEAEETNDDQFPIA